MAKNSIRDRVSYGIGRLTGAGLSRDQALGIMGSLAGESGIGLNTGAFNPKDPNGGSFGIAQMHSGRKTSMIAYADRMAAKQGLARGALRKDFKTQMDYVVHEATTKYASTMNRISRLGGTPKAVRAAASRIWTKEFEAPSAKYAHYTTRAQNAHYYAGLVGNAKIDATAQPKDVSVTGANLQDTEETPTDASVDETASTGDTSTTGTGIENRPGMPPSEGSLAEQRSRQAAEVQDTKYAEFAHQPNKEGVLGLQQDTRIADAMSTMTIDPGPASITDQAVAVADESVVGDQSVIDAAAVDESGTPAPQQKEHRSIFGRISDSISQIGEDALGIKADNADTSSTADNKKAGFLDGEVTIGAIAGTVVGGIVGGPLGSMIGGLLGQGLNNAFDGVGVDTSTGEEDGLLGGLGRSISGMLGDVFGGMSDGANTNTATHDPFGGGESGGFGSLFGGRSSSDTNQSGGRRGMGVHGLGESEQAGNHDNSSNNSGGSGGGSGGKDSKGGKK